MDEQHHRAAHEGRNTSDQPPAGLPPDDHWLAPILIPHLAPIIRAVGWLLLAIGSVSVTMCSDPRDALGAAVDAAVDRLPVQVQVEEAERPPPPW